MTKKVKAALLAIALCTIGMTAQAQFRQSIFLNGNIPTGGFSSSIGTHLMPLGLANIGKDANVGFGAGYRASYRFDVGVGIAAPFVQADLFWNTIDGDIRDEYGQLNGSAPTYFNIPILVGVSYLYDELWNDITPYAEFGLGLDMFLITSESVKPIGSVEVTRAYKTNTAFGWMIGAGAYFGQHVSAGLYYYGMGKHWIDYTSKYANENTLYQQTFGRESRTVGSLALRIGFHF